MELWPETGNANQAIGERKVCFRACGSLLFMTATAPWQLHDSDAFERLVLSSHLIIIPQPRKKPKLMAPPMTETGTANGFLCVTAMTAPESNPKQPPTEAP